MPIRIEFHYRPALVRKMTISAAEGAIVAGVIMYFIYPLDSAVLGAFAGAAGGSGMTLLFDLNTRRRARRDGAENETAYQVALEETRADVKDRSLNSPRAPTR